VKSVAPRRSTSSNLADEWTTSPAVISLPSWNFTPADLDGVGLEVPAASSLGQHALGLPSILHGQALEQRTREGRARAATGRHVVVRLAAPGGDQRAARLGVLARTILLLGGEPVARRRRRKRGVKP
jgi:hypothetical protein